MKPELTPSLIQSAWQLFFCSSTSSIHLFILIHACSFRRQSRGGKKKIYECMYVGSCCHGNRSPDTIFTNRDSPCACVCWMGEKNALWSGIGFKKWVREDPILLLPFLCMSAWAHAHLCVCLWTKRGRVLFGLGFPLSIKYNHHSKSPFSGTDKWINLIHTSRHTFNSMCLSKRDHEAAADYPAQLCDKVVSGSINYYIS